MLHNELHAVLDAVRHDPNLVAVVLRAIKALTPEEDRIRDFIAASNGVILFDRIACTNTTLATRLLNETGFRKQAIRLNGVQYSAWVHGECRFPKAALHDLLAGEQRNEQERQSVPGHARL